MSEETRELKQEEMSKVAGGTNNPRFQRNRPYCRGCGKPINMIDGYYVCDTINCPLKAVKQSASEVIWK